MEWTDDLVLKLEKAVRDRCVEMLKGRKPHETWLRWLEENDVMVVGAEDVTFNWNRWPDRVLVRSPLDGFLTPEKFLLLPDGFAEKMLVLS